MVNKVTRKKHYRPPVSSFLFPCVFVQDCSDDQNILLSFCLLLSAVYQGKKKEGNAARYVTRSQAVKQLQIGLPLFRYFLSYFA